MSAITVSASDPANYTLQNYITALATQITNAGSNGPLVAQLTVLQVQAQIQLVQSLLACGSLNAANILAGDAPTYSLPTPSAGGAI